MTISDCCHLAMQTTARLDSYCLSDTVVESLCEKLDVYDVDLCIDIYGHMHSIALMLHRK